MRLSRRRTSLRGLVPRPDSPFPSLRRLLPFGSRAREANFSRSSAFLFLAPRLLSFLRKDVSTIASLSRRPPFFCSSFLGRLSCRPAFVALTFLARRERARFQGCRFFLAFTPSPSLLFLPRGVVGLLGKPQNRWTLFDPLHPLLLKVEDLGSLFRVYLSNFSERVSRQDSRRIRRPNGWLALSAVFVFDEDILPRPREDFCDIFLVSFQGPPTP